MSAEELYSIKMRASKKENGTDVHISGAEKIVEAPDVDIFANALIERGMHHSKGEADALNLKINKVCKENIIYLDALSVERGVLNPNHQKSRAHRLKMAALLVVRI